MNTDLSLGNTIPPVFTPPVGSAPPESSKQSVTSLPKQEVTQQIVVTSTSASSDAPENRSRTITSLPATLSTPPEAITQESLLADIENGHFAQQLDRLIPAGMIEDMDQYSDRLLEDYPYDTHCLLLLGAQNVVLSGLLHNKVPEAIHESYLIDKPIRGLVNFYAESRSRKAEALFDEVAFPSKEQVGEKQLVVVRALQQGYTVRRTVTPLSQLLSQRGIMHQYDFFCSAKKHFEVEDVLKTHGKTYKLRSPEKDSQTSNFSKPFKAVELCSRNGIFTACEDNEFSAEYSEIKEWGGQGKHNPCFDHLRKYLALKRSPKILS